MGLGVEIDKPGSSISELNWTHTDRLGITDQTGALKEKLAFDPWGKRRTTDGSATPDNLSGVTDNEGYTGHEMLGQLNLVHMNGRVYDPFTGKFLSADPYVTDSDDGQNYNRYSYVLNNPTNLVDPSGFDQTVIITPNDTPCRATVCMSGGAYERAKNDSSFYQGSSNRNIATERASKIKAAIDAKVGKCIHIGCFSNIVKEYNKAGIGKGPRMGAVVGDLGKHAALSVVGPELGMMAIVKVGQLARLAYAAKGAEALGAEGKALLTANPIGSALKGAPAHLSATFMRDEAALNGTHFAITGGDGVTRTLTQVPGELNGVAGRYEYIVDSLNNLTHQMFVRGGSINGIPIKP